MGIEVNMMTGDGEITARAIAKQVGIPAEGVWASMSPKGKATVVGELMAQGKGGVAMVSSSNTRSASASAYELMPGRRRHQ